MTIVLVAGRVARHAWTSGRIVSDVANGLARRGHAVTLIAHSVEDEEAFTREGVRVLAQHVYVGHAARFPLSYGRWARQQLRDVRSISEAKDEPAVLVLTHLCADLARTATGRVIWSPVDVSAADWIRGMRVTCGAMGLLASMVRHFGALVEWVRQRRVSGSGVRGGHATVFTPIYAPLSQIPGIDRDALRLQTRAALSIGGGRLVVLVSSVDSAPMGVDPALGSVLEAAERVAKKVERGELGGLAKMPVVVVLAHQTFRVHQLERDARVHGTRWRTAGAGIRMLATTECVEAALAACDVVALLSRATRGESAEGVRTACGASRFACDAVWMHRKVIGSAARAGGLVRTLRQIGNEDAPDATEALGRLVGDDRRADPEAWQELLEWAVWKEQEGALAVDTTVVERLPRIGVETMLGELERALGA